MRYESNTHMYSKDIAQKPFFLLDIHTGWEVRTERTDKGNAIWPEKLRGDKNTYYLYFL